MDLELVTDVGRLQDYVESWDALADRVAQPRSGGGVVVAWARHMMQPGSELRVWIATDGSQVIGVLPLVAETMARGRLRLLPPGTDMMYGIVPIAHPDREEEVVGAIADDVAGGSQPVDVACIFLLPTGSRWAVALGRRLAGPAWVTLGTLRYRSAYTDIAAGIDAWLGQRKPEFRQAVRRRARRCQEEGFRSSTTEKPAEIMELLPRLQSLYLSRQQARGGEGYRFDDDMVRAIGAAAELSPPGRFGLSVLARDDVVIGASLALRAGTRMSGWLTGYDPQFSRLGAGIAALLESLEAGARAGCEIVDFGEGGQPYKDDFNDEVVPLESVTWCRPRLAALLQPGSSASPIAAV
jgi:CelD/BcsL family acetyltransferase involved in cellulose biosynthesis